MLLRGFPELRDDLPTLARKAAEIFKDLQGLFQTRDNIFFHSICRAGELLQQRAAGASFEDVYKDVPDSVASWYESAGEVALRRLVSLKAMGRFVDYFDRRSFTGRSSNAFTYRASQGVLAPLYWQAVPMMKTVWDFALVPIMVQEVRPRTIIEIGTAEGGSAAFYASVQQCHGLPPNVVTMDLIPPRSSIAGVHFVQGDSERIEAALPGELLEDLPHPWIVVEDSHRNIGGIVAHLHRFLCAGDYLSIEDIDAERDLFPFLGAHRDHYRVDTRFTDFFGHNNTCCRDQIFRRMQPGAA
jgi:cephalosporin hydroxylase